MKFWHCIPFGVGLYLGTMAGSAQLCVVVSPSTTDPNISQYNNVHTICVPGLSPSGHDLFVFLPGTDGAPIVYTNIVQEAARQGFYAVGLMYVNGDAVNNLCALQTDSTCHENVRLEVFDGTNRTALVDVSRTDSIDNRLIKLLTYLDAQYPSFDWAQFLDGSGGVRWSNVTIAGHSQGGGHAAMIGKVRPVKRVMMFASMDWYFTGNRPADWVSSPGMTKPERYFGFGHYDDELVSSNRLVAFWEELGLFDFGPQVLVDTEHAPYRGSHTFMTDVSTTNAHGSMVVDYHLPTSDTFHEEWQWMMYGPTVMPDITPADVINGHAVFETRPGTEYQIQISTNGYDYTNTGPPIQGDGTIHTVLINQATTPLMTRTRMTYGQTD